MKSAFNPFLRLGPATAVNPVILSVPHAGRTLPASVDRLCRPQFRRLMTIEDRYADYLVNDAVRGGHSALVAQTPRLWIDLNRAETDLDPDMFDHAIRMAHPISVKARGGLGLIPRRTPALGELWMDRIAATDLEERVAAHHRPYHDALRLLVETTVERFGIAILLDIHSMPPLDPVRHQLPPRVVIGDRFGRSAANWVSDRVHEIVGDHGIRVAANAPYAGGYILERYGEPLRDVHAIQIEIDRTLYLDAALDRPGAGLGAAQALIAEIASELACDADRRSLPIAAE
jgi:N-formylglutamate amidohydrolase